MPLEQIQSYLTSAIKTPYFFFLSDRQYITTIAELKNVGLDVVPISNFCGSDDKIPDMDGFLSYIEAADLNASGKKFVVTGLGEFLALCGSECAIGTLARLKDFNVGGAKVVFIFRGLASLIAELQKDLRFDARRHSVVDGANCSLSLTLASPSVGLTALTGFKALLVALENGQTDNIVVSTSVNLDQSIVTVRKISNPYEGIKLTLKDIRLERSCGTDSRWAELLTDLGKASGSLETVFEQHGFCGHLEADFHTRISGETYHHWLYFIFLKNNVDTLENSYLRFVLGQTSHFEKCVTNVLNAIIEIPMDDKRFALFYQERKDLIEKFPESDVANFVANNRKVPADSIYRLTDATQVEREEIITFIAKHHFLPPLDLIYPALANYKKKYVFKCPELADLLTQYFDDYKHQKLFNQLTPEFETQVEKLAHSPRKFNHLPARNEILDSLEKNDTYLYWLDALGVEYLGLIESVAKKHGLSMRVHIARSELPTITTINRRFFEEWKGKKNGEHGDKSLDHIKHHEVGGYDFTKSEWPIHLARELEIITAMIDRVASKLASGSCKRFVIASDHGASRLAVLRRKEEQYETDTKGEHSGRCCKRFEPYELPFAAEENGYLVLADYGRFRGSRAANVEVHGGASLEEVVVPIIELSRKDASITVQLVHKSVTVDYRTGAEIQLFFPVPAQGISVVLNGKAYLALQTDENHYTVTLPDVKRSGTYNADVYTGDDLIASVSFQAQGKSATVNNDFDDLF